MLLVVRWGGGGGGGPQQREVGAADLGHGGRGLTAATRTEPTHNALWWQLSCDSLNITDTMPQDTRILTKYAYYTS